MAEPSEKRQERPEMGEFPAGAVAPVGFAKMGWEGPSAEEIFGLRRWSARSPLELMNRLGRCGHRSRKAEEQRRPTLGTRRTYRHF